MDADRVWTWPNDALGRLAAAMVPAAARREVDGATFVEDHRFGRLFRLFPNRPSAMTFGSTVVASRRLDDALVAHELAHVRQYRRFGPLYLGLYVLGSAWGAVRHGQSYLGNPFEIEAMEVARRETARRDGRLREAAGRR